MLSQIVSLLALIPMLLHSIVGCCWHHSHGAMGGTSRIATVSSMDEGMTHRKGVAKRDHSVCCHQGHWAVNSHLAPQAYGEHSDDRDSRFPCQDEPCGLVPATYWVTAPHVVLDDVSLGILLLDIAPVTPFSLFLGGNFTLTADHAQRAEFSLARRVLLQV